MRPYCWQHVRTHTIGSRTRQYHKRPYHNDNNVRSITFHERPYHNDNNNNVLRGHRQRYLRIEASDIDLRLFVLSLRMHAWMPHAPAESCWGGRWSEYAGCSEAFCYRRDKT